MNQLRFTRPRNSRPFVYKTQPQQYYHQHLLHKQPLIDEIFHSSEHEDSSMVHEGKQLVSNDFSQPQIQLFPGPSKIPEDFEYTYTDEFADGYDPSIYKHRPKDGIPSKYDAESQPYAIKQTVEYLDKSLYEYPSFDSDDSYFTSSKSWIKKQTKQHDSQKIRNSRRKVRTMITEQKLNLMNVIFQNFMENTSPNIANQDKVGKLMLKKLIKQQPDIKQAEITNINNLKNIGKILNLAYSTVLHKYKEFRENKQVKGGPRMLSKYIKHKYKKSYQIEEYIARALSERPFYTALELSKYICSKYGIFYPRCNINRHLIEMGFNLNMTPLYLKKINTTQVKDIRRVYANALKLYYDMHGKENIVFVDEFLFEKDRKTLEAKRQLFNNVSSGQTSWPSDSHVSLFLAVSPSRVVYSQVKQGIFTKTDFQLALERTRFSLDMTTQTTQRKVIVLDLHPIHIHESSVKTQQVPASAQNTLRSCGFRRLYLPPYSPELNPCLNIFQDIQANIHSYRCHRLGDFSLSEELESFVPTINVGQYFAKMDQWTRKALNMESL